MMDNTQKVCTTLDVTLFGKVEPINDLMSKCRVRIFYKGMNRNRTFISDDFANQLIASLPYAPVKGIFNKEEVDFEDHGEESQDGKIYAIVPAEPNFAWEDHMDTDGVIRTYACADVFIYTALYPEAKIINGSSQSMEIYPDTMKGEWRIAEDGYPYYHFLEGSLLGLQILGAKTEPCFEGAAFFSYFQEMKDLIDALKNAKIEKKEENAKMDMSLFRLSDNEKAEKIWLALNPNFNETGEVNYIILDVYDDYALVGSISDGSYARVTYTKTEDDNVEIGEVTTVYIVDVTETEKNALEAMKAIGSYAALLEILTENKPAENSGEEGAEEPASTETTTEPVVETQNSLDNEGVVETATEDVAEGNAEGNAEETTEEPATEPVVEPEVNSAYEDKIAELETKISEYKAQIEAYEAEKLVFEQKQADLINENENLKAFKANTELAQKQEILSNMSEHLNDELISEYTANMGNYSVEDFEKEINNAAVKNDPSIFKKREEPAHYFKGETDPKVESGMERLLREHKMRNGGNK